MRKNLGEAYARGSANLREGVKPNKYCKYKLHTSVTLICCGCELHTPRPIEINLKNLGFNLITAHKHFTEIRESDTNLSTNADLHRCSKLTLNG